LLFNAFLKVPMQFIILLTGVLVFVFYHFHAPQLLWNPAEMKRLQERTPPAEMSALQARFRDAQAARRAAAEEFLRQRGSEAREAAAREYLEAEGALQAARSQAVRRVEALSGGKRYNDTNYIFPTYILTQLPRGLVGLVIAVIFAAAMSTLSGELSSLATATVVDFYKRFVRPHGGDAHELLVSRILTGFWGCFASLVALQAGRLGSAIEVVNRFGSYFYGSILGVFALAVLTPRASARGAFYGLFAGMAAVALVSQTTVHFLWYNVVGAVTVFTVGLAITAASRDTSS
jgi:Na+(H+)/acetate symporter ActP